MSGVVIIGGGQAGFEAATSLRSRGYAGEITIIGDEAGVPYQRPPLSKAYLHSAPDSDSLELRPQSYYDEHRIALRCGKPAVDIDRAARTVELVDGSTLEYEHLVLATGARNRTVPIQGATLDGVHYLRTSAEADRLTAELNKCSAVVVIGAGFIGLEVAAAARKKGRRVTVLEAMDRPMSRALSPAMSTYFAALHSDHGVDLRLSTGVREIIGGDGRVKGVVTATGENVPADVVVVGIGVVPNTELAERIDLVVDNGIVVDELLRTSDDRIYAIGDCAAYPSVSGHGRVRLESVQNAVDHARCIAAHITGVSSPYCSVPWFWSEQYTAKLQIAGLATGFDTTVLRGSVEDETFSVFCFRGSELVGVESINSTRDHMAARKILALSMPLTPEQASDNAFDLKSAVAEYKSHKAETIRLVAP